MNPDAIAVPLDQALPDDVANRRQGLFSYQNYPVFSLPWLKKRSLLFGIAIGLVSLLVLIGVWIGSQKLQSASMSAAHFFLAFMVMATAGPSLASWVRYRRFARSKERSGVVIAVMLGIVAGYGVDRWSSAYLEKTIITRSSTGANVDEAAGKIATNESGKIVVNRDLEKRAREPWVIAINGIFLVMIYGALGGGFALRAYFSEQRRLTASQHKRELAAMRLQKDETALRLSVLQAQVEPHFLFNTLASLRSLVRQDPARAETTIDALVDHLRATIPKMRDDTGKLASTLGQQLDICSSYLKLMQVRMGPRLTYAVIVPDSFREFEFPPLMLISLVENAIKHGVEAQPGEARIQIHAEKMITDAGEEKLKVSVVDNGLGLRRTGWRLGFSQYSRATQSAF